MVRVENERLGDLLDAAIDALERVAEDSAWPDAVETANKRIVQLRGVFDELIAARERIAEIEPLTDDVLNSMIVKCKQDRSHRELDSVAVYNALNELRTARERIAELEASAETAAQIIGDMQSLAHKGVLVDPAHEGDMRDLAREAQRVLLARFGGKQP